MRKRTWWLYAFSHGFPIGLGYAGFGHFVTIWLKQMGCSNIGVPLSKALLLPLLLRTLPFSACGIKKITLNQGMALCCIGLGGCLLSNGNPWLLCGGAFIGCIGMSFFEAFYGHRCTSRYNRKSLRDQFVGVYYMGYRVSGLLSKGLCVYLAGFLGWQIPYLFLLIVLCGVWYFLAKASRDRTAKLDSFWPTLRDLWKKTSKVQMGVVFFCLIPDAFFEALIIPFWMDHHISLSHIALAKGVCASGGAIVGASIALWSVRKIGLMPFFKTIIPINLFFHLLPLGYIYSQDIMWVYITSLFAHVGHSMLSAAYYMYIIRCVQNSREFEIFVSLSYVVTFISSLSGLLWALLGSSWVAFFCVVAAMNVFTSGCLRRLVK